MKKIGILAVLSALIISIIASQFRLIHHPVTDNDEGIYLTTFLLQNQGHPVYKETFLSQPPGFLLSTYPGFYMLGKTLTAGRATIGFWSIIGLVAIVWIGYELGNVWIGILCIPILYLIRYYTNQTLTFQSDIIVSTFSLLCFGSILRFLKSSRPLWIVLAGILFNFAFWTKFDVLLLPVFMVILWQLPKLSKMSRISFIGILSAVVVILFVILVLPFGIKEVFQNSILLRAQALTQPASFFLLLDYIKADVALSVVLPGTLLLVYISRKKMRFPAVLLIVWFFSSCAFFFFYRPLFPHHMAILSIPTSLTFSYLLYLNVKSTKKLFSVIVFSVLIISILNYGAIILKTPTNMFSEDEKKAIEVIVKNSNPGDTVVSDEEILTAMSGRLPPPQLSDLSFVRTSSQNLSAERFGELMRMYKPKLIIAWNGHLRSIRSFNDVLTNYTLLTSYNNSQDIYVRKAQ